MPTATGVVPAPAGGVTAPDRGGSSVRPSRQEPSVVGIAPVKSSVSVELQHVRVAHLVPSLSFYLALGCEARQSGDGWVRLRNAGTVFVLEHGDPGGRPGAVVPELSTGDLLRLCCRLWSAGIDTSPISYPDGVPGGRISTHDPDLHPVAVSQAGRRPRAEALVVRRTGVPRGDHAET